MNEHLKRLKVIRKRMAELKDLCTKEKRELSEEERTEWDALRAERQQLNLEVELAAMGKDIPTTDAARAFDEVMRTARKEKRSVETMLPRAIQNLATVTAGGMVPLTIGDIFGPLEKGLILNKVGLKLQTGLAGDYVYPFVTSGVEATIEDENAEVADTTIPLSQLKPTPKRIAIAIPVSNTAIDQTEGLIWQIVQQQAPLAIARLLNKAMFTQGSTLALKGPMDATGIGTVEFAGDTPTWAELLKLPATVAAKGIEVTTACYVMTSAMYYALKGTPKDAGSGRFIIEEDRIDGIPVYVTEYMPAGTILFGNWSYELQGQFGQTRVTIDPITGAKKNLTYLIINTSYSMTTARPEAFVVGSKKK